MARISHYRDEDDVHRMGEAAVSESGAWEFRITLLEHETYEDEDTWESTLAGQLRILMDVIDRTGWPVTDGAMARLADLKAEWQTRQEELRRIPGEHWRLIKACARQQGVDHVQRTVTSSTQNLDIKSHGYRHYLPPGTARRGLVLERRVVAALSTSVGFIDEALTPVEHVR